MALALDVSPGPGDAFRRAARHSIATTRLRARVKEPVIVKLYYKGVGLRDVRVWLSRRLGSGGFGVVLEADMLATSREPAEPVAVKRFDPQDDLLFEREVSRWHGLDHPRILPFYGICELGAGQVGLVSPLCRKGNMRQFIAKHPNTDRLRLVKQVADAVRYLHVTAGIVHGDLKCGNVLISDNDDALLADFGLSTVIERTETPTATFLRICSTAHFAAPELFEDQAFNIADAVDRMTPRSKTPYSDVYAFAGLVYEAFSGEIPWQGATVPELIKHACDGDYPPREVGNPVYSPLSDRLWKLCLDCWQRDAFARPGFTEICDILDGLDA